MNYISMTGDKDIIRNYLVDNYITELKLFMRQNARADAIKRHWVVNEIIYNLNSDNRRALDILKDMSKDFHHYAKIAHTPRQVMLFVCAYDIIDDCVDLLRAKGDLK